MDLPVGPGHRLLGRTTSSTVRRSAAGRFPASPARRPASPSRFTTRPPISAASTSRRPPGRHRYWQAPQTNYSNPDNAFNTTYFSAAPPTGRVGTSGRNQYYGPGLFNWDLALLEELRDLERANPPVVPGGFLQPVQPHEFRESGPQREQRIHVSARSRRPWVAPSQRQSALPPDSPADRDRSSCLCGSCSDRGKVSVVS